MRTSCVFLFNSHNHPVGLQNAVSENQGPERLGNLAMVTQHIHDRVGFKTRLLGPRPMERSGQPVPLLLRHTVWAQDRGGELTKMSSPFSFEKINHCNSSSMPVFHNFVDLDKCRKHRTKGHSGNALAG